MAVPCIAVIGVRSAVGVVLKASKPRTPDLGGKDGTKDVADAVRAAL